jgi:transcriptional regulator with XRE-family HTH domain
MARPGQPTKFTDVDKEYWAFLISKGYTNKQIAEKIGVEERTIYNWKKKHTAFFQSLKEFREFVDSDVEASLFQRAMGYKTKEVKLFQDKRGNIIEHEVIKSYPPETVACIFWLKNRKPNEWRDSHEVKVREEVRQLTDEELKKIVAENAS